MAGLSLFQGRKFKRHTQKLNPATISDFGGGLNLVDNDVTMKSRFAKVLRNWNKNVDGSQSVRWGTRFKFDISNYVDGNIIEIIDFSRRLICVTDQGEIAAVTTDGTIEAIWNEEIANAEFGSPTGWSTGLVEGSIDYTEFKGDLIIVNGVDKPLIIDEDADVGYLNDPATGSNVNTPIAKYVTTVSNYVVMAGIDGEEGAIYISSQGTSGVWPGDDPPNDAVSVVLSAWVPQNSGDILGLGSFRNFLLAAFDGAIVVVELGVYDDTTHTPRVQDNIVEHGFISHRTTAVLKSDFVMGSVLGWHAALRNEFGLIDTRSLSGLVDPGYAGSIPEEQSERNKCFMVRNRAEQRIMLYVPSATGSVVWTMTSNSPEQVKNQAWCQYTGWDWTCGTATERGRVFFAKGSKIYQYGNEVYADEDYTADKTGDYDSSWLTGTEYVVGDKVLHSGSVYLCVTNHTADDFDIDLSTNLHWEEYFGDEIEFDWELPWIDINRRVNKKKVQFFHADTDGAGQFTVDAFVDNYYLDTDGEYDPAIQMTFFGGNAGGYGGDPDQSYGGGRKARDERMWGFPVEFKILKLRLHGSTRERLKIITISLLYRIGTFRRA